MSNCTKYFFIIFFSGLHHICAGLPSYESFHSDIGEVLILSPLVHKNLPDQKFREGSIIVTEHSENQVDQSSEKTNQEIEIKSHERKVDKENPLVLSDEEIEELLFSELLGWEQEDDEIIIEAQDWYRFHGFEMGWGYSDNPLGSAYNQEGSPFTELSLESFFLNQKNPQHQALAYLLAEGKNFYQLEISGLILSQFEYSYKPVGGDDSYGLQFQYTFFDQGMDASEFPYETEHRKITSQNFEISPHFKWVGEGGDEGKLQFNWSKERLRQFDQNTKLGISTTLSNQYAEPLKWEAKLFHILTNYKGRDPDPRNDNDNPHQDSLETKRSGLSLKLTSPKENGWTKNLSLSNSIENVNDNYAGYYDYRRYKATLEKKWGTENWESDFSLGYNLTNYSERLAENQEKLTKDHWSFELRFFRELNQYWKSYAKWIHDSDRSNDPDFTYESNFWSVGMAWEK